MPNDPLLSVGPLQSANALGALPMGEFIQWLLSRSGNPATNPPANAAPVAQIGAPIPSNAANLTHFAVPTGFAPGQYGFPISSPTAPPETMAVRPPNVPLPPSSLIHPTNQDPPFPGPRTTVMPPRGGQPLVSPAPVTPVQATAIPPGQGYAPRYQDPMASSLPTAPPPRPTPAGPAALSAMAPSGAPMSIPSQAPAAPPQPQSPPPLPSSPTHRASASAASQAPPGAPSEADQLNALFSAALRSGNRAPFDNEIEARRRRHASK